jgi:hypothetical protein
MSCARRSVWPVIETISGSVQPASANIVTVVPRIVVEMKIHNAGGLAGLLPLLRKIPLAV